MPSNSEQSISGLAPHNKLALQSQLAIFIVRRGCSQFPVGDSHPVFTPPESPSAKSPDQENRGSYYVASASAPVRPAQ